MIAKRRTKSFLYYIEQNDRKGFEKALDKQANNNTINLNIPNKSGAPTTPLCHAIEQGNVYMVKALIEKGADANTVNGRNESPLQIAIRLNYIEIIRLLIVTGATITNKDETSLQYACRMGSLNAVKFLLGKCDVNYLDLQGCTALHIAVLNNRVDIAEILLKNNAKCDLKNFARKSPLNLAASSTNENMRMLFQKYTGELASSEKQKDRVDNLERKISYINAREKHLSTFTVNLNDTVSTTSNQLKPPTKSPESRVGSVNSHRSNTGSELEELKKSVKRYDRDIEEINSKMKVLGKVKKKKKNLRQNALQKIEEVEFDESNISKALPFVRKPYLGMRKALFGCIY